MGRFVHWTHFVYITNGIDAAFILATIFFHEPDFFVQFFFGSSHIVK